MPPYYSAAMVRTAAGTRAQHMVSMRKVAVPRPRAAIVAWNMSTNSPGSGGDKDKKNVNVLKAIEEKKKGEAPQKNAFEMEEMKKMAENTLGEQKRLITQTWNEIQTNWAKNKAEKIKKERQASTTDSQEWYAKRVNFWMKRYENFVGLTEVKASQGKVVQMEKKFVETQDQRRDLQMGMTDIQSKLKSIHSELEKTHRGEEKYLILVTEEHHVLQEERNLLTEFQQTEKHERECFSHLSNAVRDSHEKERAQAEKTKYWSVIGSVVGTCLGILGTTINNRMRMRELRELVTSSASGEKMVTVTEQLGASLEAHEDRLGKLVEQISTIITDSKLSLVQIGDMRMFLDRLAQTGEKFNVAQLETTTGLVLKRSEELNRNVLNQRKMFQEVKTELRTQTGAVENVLTNCQKEITDVGERVQARDQVMRESLESIYKNQTNILGAFQTRIAETQEKVTDVKNLIEGLQTSASARRKQEKNFLKDLDETLVDKIENAIDDSEARTRSAVWMGAAFVAVVTPVAVYAVNKLL